MSTKVSEVRARIARAGGDPDRITLLAVTKGFGADACRAALDAGLVDLGESYAQEAMAKVVDLDDARARWHFIGRLQTNKVRSLADSISLWQSVDRAALVDEIGRRAPGARVLIQLNISDERQKGGCRPEDVGALLARAADAGLAVVGLMGVGPDGPPEAARPAFRLLAGVADELGLPERSMGMTGDLEVAIEEGSTMVRVGSGLFGPRRSRDLPRD